MGKESYQQGENTVWEISRTVAKLSRRKKLIELLQEYNEQDEQRLIELASYN
jgi:hypothetical protein